MPIRALNSATVNLITSTQIITSVSSVVKELVENSLDADAKNIEINLTDNGSSLIEIRDDGCGISISDVPSMALPHYTSKLSDFSDLESITTYGFRGEAVNAICRVAEVEVTTKTIDDDTAKVYKLDSNGGIVGTETSHRYVGTTVRVKDLFKNVSVRRQILNNPRKLKQDLRLIENILKSLSICQPVVRMSFRVNNNLVFLKPSCHSMKEALSHFVGNKIAGNMESIQNEDSEGRLQLMIPKRDLIDPQLVYESNQQYVIVNSRPVKYKQFEKIIQERVSDHFGSRAPPKKHPVYLLSVTVAASDIDVNLEPNKTSVILKNQDIIMKKLDKILVEFYNIIDENTRPDLSSSNLTIDPSLEYQDITTSNFPTDVEVSACKKPKLDNNKQRRRDSIIDVNADSPAGGKKKGGENRSNRNSNSNDKQNQQIVTEDPRANRDSIDRILNTFPAPILSDSDDEFSSGTPRKRKSGAPMIVGHAVRSTDAEQNNVPYGGTGTEPRTSAWAGAGVAPNASESDHETLSQLPVVDLGEDFDIEAILERPPLAKIPKLENDSCVSNTITENTAGNSVTKTNYTLVDWSRGQVPGLKGSTDVSTYNDSVNKPKPKGEGQSKGEEDSQTVHQTGFSKFSYEIRSQVVNENPGATLPAIGKILADRWKELSSEERGYYRDLALEEKKRLEVDKKKAKKQQMSQQESDKNKARLVQMLESMKKTKSNKKCLVNERTTVTWEINIQNITESFFAKPVSEENEVIGRLTDDIWAARSSEKILVVNSPEVLKTVDPKELDEQEITSERTAKILESWLREKKMNFSSPAITHQIYDIKGSTV